ncbi:MAG: menaquinone biosynthesis protein [Desulfuromonadaceae bacterium]|nr:menaquinone biosynthesis protein [Desulfuromonadaceae bacterium]
MLRIGQIEYANCTPIYHILREYFRCSGYEFVKGVPTGLNRLLELGKIDLCPSSSIEYALHPDRYRILPQLSISSDGAVASVLLFSRIPIEKLDGNTILLSSESATSVNLLKILMAQRFNCSCRYAVTSLPFSDAIIDSPALLLIGDAALRASFSGSDLYMYDLGALWREWTGLPFVFALWLCRSDVAESPKLKELANNLIQARILLPMHYAEIAERAHEASWMGYDRLLAYWRENIQYDLENRKISGLVTFYKKCRELGLITSVPELCFTEL